jgi:transcription initiation factor TFIIB
MGAEFDLPEPELEEAARLYRNARTAGSITGRSVEGFVTACLLAAIRRSPSQIPVSERELRTVTRADCDQIRTARGALTLELDVEIPPLEAVAFLPRAVSELSTSNPVERCARNLLDSYTGGEGAHRGTSPRTLAAAAVHAAYDRQECEERPKLEALSDVFDVARSTISSQKNSLTRVVEDDV